MSRLPVKLLSKVQNILWNYDTANLAICRAKCWGHSVLHAPALVWIKMVVHIHCETNNQIKHSTKRTETNMNSNVCFFLNSSVVSS